MHNKDSQYCITLTFSPSFSKFLHLICQMQNTNPINLQTKIPLTNDEGLGLTKRLQTLSNVTNRHVCILSFVTITRSDFMVPQGKPSHETRPCNLASSAAASSGFQKKKKKHQVICSCFHLYYLTPIISGR